MKGIELARLYYREYGAPMLEQQFREYVGVIAVGLIGSGSECFGYDDEQSRDHDFEPGFCLFLPDEEIVDCRTAFLLERAYAKLPSEFMGYRREKLSPVGGNRHGVLRMSDFFLEKTGSRDGTLTPEQWFSIPEQSLAEATNGEIFRYARYRDFRLRVHGLFSGYDLRANDQSCCGKYRADLRDEM